METAGHTTCRSEGTRRLGLEKGVHLVWRGIGNPERRHNLKEGKPVEKRAPREIRAPRIAKVLRRKVCNYQKGGDTQGRRVRIKGRLLELGTKRGGIGVLGKNGNLAGINMGTGRKRLLSSHGRELSRKGPIQQTLTSS